MTTTPLIAVLPYCRKDQALATKLLQWISDLGGCKDHSCILLADTQVPEVERAALKELARKSFRHAGTLPCTPPKAALHPPNFMFLMAAQQMQLSYKLPWLWLEPDCVPLRAQWLDLIANEYALCCKKFMGNLTTGKQEGLPTVHLPGVSVYPNNAYDLYSKIESLKTENVAWDMEAAGAVVPRSAHTSLIHHFWGEPELPPTFVLQRKPDSPQNCLQLGFINKNAVLFHRCKDGSLIELLRSVLKIPAAIPTPPPAKT